MSSIIYQIDLLTLSSLSCPCWHRQDINQETLEFCCFPSTNFLWDGLSKPFPTLEAYYHFWMWLSTTGLWFLTEQVRELVCGHLKMLTGAKLNLQKQGRKLSHINFY